MNCDWLMDVLIKFLEHWTENTMSTRENCKLTSGFGWRIDNVDRITHSCDSTFCLNQLFSSPALRSIINITLQDAASPVPGQVTLSCYCLNNRLFYLHVYTAVVETQEQRKSSLIKLVETASPRLEREQFKWSEHRLKGPMNNFL